MSTNKLFLWIAAALLSGAFCAASAMAEVERPEAYKQLTAVELSPEQSPMVHGGIAALSGNELRHRERLPVQLEGPLHKMKKAKYSPKIRKARTKRARS